MEFLGLRAHPADRVRARALERFRLKNKKPKDPLGISACWEQQASKDIKLAAKEKDEEAVTYMLRHCRLCGLCNAKRFGGAR